MRLSMTAEALLMREYLGWKRTDPRLVAGIEWITAPENLIDFENNRDVYFWYYATQAAHHFEDALASLEALRAWPSLARSSSGQVTMAFPPRISSSTARC